MRYDGIDCRYYQINNRISKQGKNVSNLRYSTSSPVRKLIITTVSFKYS